MNAASLYPAISARMRATAHRFANKYELEVADLTPIRVGDLT